MLTPTKETALENILRTWRLIAPRTSADMERVRLLSIVELAKIGDEIRDPHEIERRVIPALRAIEDAIKPRRTRTRRERPRD